MRRKYDASKLSDLYAKANALPIFEYYLITYYDDLPAPGKGTANRAVLQVCSRAENLRK